MVVFEISFTGGHLFSSALRLGVCFYDVRHVSGEPGYGIGNLTVKMMNQDGTFLPGEITKDLGYVRYLETFLTLL